MSVALFVRRLNLVALAAIASLILLPAKAFAEWYPSEPVQLESTESTSAASTSWSLSRSPGTSHSSWGSLTGPDCPDGEPNVWMATIDIGDGLTVRVNAPLCYNCLRPPDPELPYHSPDGLAVVIEALEPYGG